MAKYAKIINNVVDTISDNPLEGFVEVADTVFARMVKAEDGTFDYTDEEKTAFTAERNRLAEVETKKASGKQKLLDLGLSEEEVKALIGI